MGISIPFEILYMWEEFFFLKDRKWFLQNLYIKVVT